MPDMPDKPTREILEAITRALYAPLAGTTTREEMIYKHVRRAVMPPPKPDLNGI